MKFLAVFFAATCIMLTTACKKDDPEPPTSDGPVLRLKIKLDPNQERLDNLGNPSSLPSGHGALSPSFRGLSMHFIELISNELTAYGAGAELYKGAEVAATNPNPYGFTTAADFDQAIVKADGETFLEIPLSSIPAGTYRHLRASVIYQNYDIRFNLLNVPVIGDLNDQNGTVASFVGYNNHINDLTVRSKTIPVNETKLQGYWAFETDLGQAYASYNQTVTGQAPQNATTVVNPFPNAPIPQGSCVVSGSLDQDLVITGNETADISLTLSFSVNQSFEWIDDNGNGEWDIDASGSSAPEAIVDMGLRGLKGLVGQ